VTKGLAEMKFSGSPSNQGSKIDRENKNVNIIIKPKTSFQRKKGSNFTLSKSLLVPKGLPEPLSCKKNKWSTDMAPIIKGNKKWRAKKRVRVALSTEKPPHSQKTISEPTYGMAEKRFVITVAPQKDIWPQGST